MQRHARLLILFCTLAIAGLLTLQFYWIKNYYAVHKAGFEKEVNLAFEDAVRKEFSLRCDTITQLIVDKLMDTTEFEITSERKKDSVTYQYTVSNKHNAKDKWSFSLHGINAPIVDNDIILKKNIAIRFTESLRTHDLESHMVWYRTQNLGSFMDEKVKQYNFDTTRLRPVLTHYLLQRDITVPFQFYLKQDDSTMNQNNFPKALLAKFPVITKSYPTYKLVDDSHYVRAMFVNPSAYIIGKMKFIFISSILLILCVLASMFLLFKMWFREKRLSAIKNDFINNITHEFKTPIATVSAAVEALADFDVLEDKEKTNRYLIHSKNELQRLSGLVDQLLNISIYENSTVELKPVQINIEEAVQMIIQSHLVAAVKPIHFSFSNNTGVDLIKGDKVQFHHAVNNVIDNAIKYSGNPVTITIDCIVKDNFLVLSIADNGTGIAQKEIPFVFDKFYRVKTEHTRLVKGYGLGLNYVKSIVDLHGGWYLLKSKPGQGSVVSLAWPI
ncbi:sensor histidine kinase [Ferruginibacter sp. SUN106]|uniref:sensor histidine kinase n=1 Tax=Ferruginibacter sp. SUN106 TaxID=2978348 RepID=UPI003D35E39F